MYSIESVYAKIAYTHNLTAHKVMMRWSFVQAQATRIGYSWKAYLSS
jgi:hypothetical protein